MKTISKIIYTIIVCKFILGIRERLMSKVLDNDSIGYTGKPRDRQPDAEGIL